MPATCSTVVPTAVAFSLKRSITSCEAVTSTTIGLEDRAEDPGVELLFADAGQLALGPFAGSDSDDLLEDLVAHLVKRDPVQDPTAVDVHVRFLVGVKGAVGRQLNGRSRLEAEGRAAP